MGKTSKVILSAIAAMQLAVIGAQAQSLSVTKACASPVVTNIGSSLTVTGAVCNTGTIELTNVVIVDATSGLPPLATNIIDVLPVGACSNYTFTYTATTCDPNHDSVTVTGSDATSGQAITASASADCFLCCPAITITNLIGNRLPGDICSGSISDYGPIATNQNNSSATNGFCYVIIVRNTGHDPLTNIVIVDDKLGSLGTFPGPLAVGGTITISNLRTNWTEPTTNTTSVFAQCGGVHANGAVTTASSKAVAIVYPPPVINCPTNLVVECSGGLTPVVYPPVTAFDFNGNPLAVTCTPPSGSNFSLGESQVVCAATDSLGVTNACSFNVTVVDTTPPTVTCPSNILVVAANSGGALVNYVATATDACGIESFECVPPPGSLFPNGITTVTCTAKDTRTNLASCSFTVTVGGADLLVSKSANKGTVKPGQTIVYTIGVNNLGPAPAKNVVLNDAIPQGTVFLSATTKGGGRITAPPSGSAGTVTWYLGDLGAQVTSTNNLTVTVVVRGNASIVNTATATSDTWDQNLLNNTATVTTRRNK